jgi:hypothetical protein
MVSQVTKLLIRTHVAYLSTPRYPIVNGIDIKATAAAEA